MRGAGRVCRHSPGTPLIVQALLDDCNGFIGGLQMEQPAFERQDAPEQHGNGQRGQDPFHEDQQRA